jgi:interferon gamma-inducible protein 30
MKLKDKVLNIQFVIDVYFEANCPYSQQLILNNMKQLLSAQGYEEFVDVNFYPFGNGLEIIDKGQYEFKCQHGGEECKGNMLIACALKYFEKKFAFDFIVCILETGLNYKTAAEMCLSDHPQKLKEVIQCSTLEYGSKLMHLIAQKTNDLIPPLQYVPLVTVNGKQNEDICNTGDVISYLCNLQQDYYSNYKICIDHKEKTAQTIELTYDYSPRQFLQIKNNKTHK